MSSLFTAQRGETLLLFIIVVFSLYLGNLVGALFEERVMTVFITFGFILIFYGVFKVIVKGLQKE